MDLFAHKQRLLACLGDPSRFRVMKVLLEGEHCVSEIAGFVGLSQSCTTRHLQALQREGVVTRNRSGKRVFFRMAETAPEIAGILEWAMLRAPTPEHMGKPQGRPARASARAGSKRRRAVVKRWGETTEPKSPVTVVVSQDRAPAGPPIVEELQEAEENAPRTERRTGRDMVDYLL